MASLPVSGLYRMEAPSSEEARRGLAELERRFEQQAAARAARVGGAEAQSRALRGALNLTGSSTDELTAVVRQLRQEQGRGAKRKTGPPRVKRARPRLFTGSIGATLTPPYDYSWTWHAGNGGPDVNTASANNDNGAWSVSDWTSQNDSSNASARGAVGVFFRPPTETGILQVWANPALAFDWGDWCVTDGPGPTAGPGCTSGNTTSTATGSSARR
jgi:hypothetical protein